MGIKGETLRDTSIAFVVVSPLFVIARFVCRLINQGLGSDDWTIVLGLVCVIMRISLQIINHLHQCVAQVFTNVLNIMHIVGEPA